MRIVLLGAPGVGKGTQARRIAADRGWAHVSTGEMLRDAVARRTPLGLEAARRMDTGDLVPDDVMIGLVSERLAQPDAAAGFVLDGFPRTVPQADALAAVLRQRGQAIDAVVLLTVPEEMVVSRLTGRRECPLCKRAYNRDGVSSRDGVHCDDHPAVELAQRTDDGDQTVRRRLAVYRAQTEPLVAYYQAAGRLHEVPGGGTVDEVYQAMMRVLDGARERSDRGLPA